MQRCIILISAIAFADEGGTGEEGLEGVPTYQNFLLIFAALMNLSH